MQFAIPLNFLLILMLNIPKISQKKYKKETNKISKNLESNAMVEYRNEICIRKSMDTTSNKDAYNYSCKDRYEIY
jgi:hypothetical protein